MLDEVYGVALDHPSPRKPRRFLNLRSHVHFIAVDLAVSTDRLVLSEAAFFHPLFCIFEKLPAIRAEFALPVIMTAMDADHPLDGFNLSFGAVHLSHHELRYETPGRPGVSAIRY